MHHNALWVGHVRVPGVMTIQATHHASVAELQHDVYVHMYNNGSFRNLRVMYVDD